MTRASTYRFEPARHESELLAIIGEIGQTEQVGPQELQSILRRYPKNGREVFSKSELIRGYRYLAPRHGLDDEASFARRMRMKPVRTQSGVAPVTVLTKPYPCPGKCIFCPSDVRMPKSYLSREPGAQRAAQHDFDPYGQTLGRLLAYHHNGHPVDKVELIILGGTWSFYPEPYQVWFVKRSFDAMNAFAQYRGDWRSPELERGPLSFEGVEEEVDGRHLERSYNQVIARYLAGQLGGALLAQEEHAEWAELEAAQEANERAAARCVGLVVETRPDHLSEDEVVRMRRLGATKVQIGIQSLSDRVLELNHRGCGVDATRRALRLLRGAGFKLHCHWMPNLYGSDPESDVEDFERLFAESDFRPDELKIYPCSLIESAELVRYHDDGRWRPYTRDELLEVLTRCLLLVPRYCRVTRVIRDIPGDEILVGNRITNFRQLAELELERQGLGSVDIRAREIRGQRFENTELELRKTAYETSVGEEVFLEFVTPEDRIAGFLRLSLPEKPVLPAEVAESAMIREVHVYGQAAEIGERRAGRAQHQGLGRRLVEAARELAEARGFSDLAVISAIGTRDYYRGLGFDDRAPGSEQAGLYQHRPLAPEGPAAISSPAQAVAGEAMPAALSFGEE